MLRQRLTLTQNVSSGLDRSLVTPLTSDASVSTPPAGPRKQMPTTMTGRHSDARPSISRSQLHAFVLTLCRPLVHTIPYIVFLKSPAPTDQATEVEKHVRTNTQIQLHTPYGCTILAKRGSCHNSTVSFARSRSNTPTAVSASTQSQKKRSATHPVRSQCRCSRAS